MLAISRGPNQLEEIMIAALDQRRERRRKVPRNSARESATQAIASGESSCREIASKGPRQSASKPSERKATLDRQQAAVQAAVKRLVGDPKADPAAIFANLRSSSPDAEPRLVSIVLGGQLAEQLAAVRLLAESGNPAVVPTLLQAGNMPRLRIEAARAVARLADTQTIHEIVRQATDTEMQRILLAGLLARGDAAALTDYLNDVQSDTLGETALSAAELVQNPPIELLFEFLQSPSELNRVAAARVIGRIDGPATTQRLIAMIEQGTSRQEVCVALLSSRGQEAVNFVANARENPMLAGMLQTARLFVSTHSQPRS
jgi:predicted esterase YcpF (UPF0227 family)